MAFYTNVDSTSQLLKLHRSKNFVSEPWPNGLYTFLTYVELTYKFRLCSDPIHPICSIQSCKIKEINKKNCSTVEKEKYNKYTINILYNVG